MDARRNRHGLGALFTVMIGAALLLPELGAQAPSVPPLPPNVRLVSFVLKPLTRTDAARAGEGNTDVLLTELAAQAPPAPKVSFLLKDRHGHTTPARTDAAHTGGGNTEVAQPREDTLIITMSGVVTAGPHPIKGSAADMEFDLNQEFVIGFADPMLKKAKLTAEAQVVGLLRGDKNGGSANVGHGSVVIACAGGGVLALDIEGHAVSGDDNLAINDHKGPVSIAVPPGDYHLLQAFRIHADHVRSICGKAAAAEFAPEAALDPTWISITDPFRGANKKEFGFRVILRIEPD
jgi:hypothetical protein